MFVYGQIGQFVGVKIKSEQYANGEYGTAYDQQHRLDYLDPGGRNHAAERHIDRHQHADDEYALYITETKQGFDQGTGSHHLCQEVGYGNGQGSRCCQHPDWPGRQPDGDCVRKGIRPQVAQLFSDQEQDNRPAQDQVDDEIDGVITADEQQADQPEERGG